MFCQCQIRIVISTKIRKDIIFGVCWNPTVWQIHVSEATVYEITHLHAFVTELLLRYNPRDVYVTIVRDFFRALVKMDNDDSSGAVKQNPHGNTSGTKFS